MNRSVFYFQEKHGYSRRINLATALNIAFLEGSNRQKVKQALYDPSKNEYFFKDGSRVFREVS